MRIVYISNTRLPTEKAHGYQIIKMCEAFARNNASLLLIHPYRRQIDPQLKSKTIFEYYGIKPCFDIQTIGTFDIYFIEKYIPGIWFRILLVLHAYIWSLIVVRKCIKTGPNLYYTRDIEVAFWLSFFKVPNVFEYHVRPKGLRLSLYKRVFPNNQLKGMVVLTSFIKNGLIKVGYPQSRILVLPDAVDLDSFSDLPNKQECRRRLGIPLESYVIGYIGRFKTMGMEKGIPDLVKAMTQLSINFKPDPLLLCVGGPLTYVPNYISIARNCGLSIDVLRFVDRVPNSEIPLWIKAFDIAVAPFPENEHYSFFMSPLKIFEYMAGGVPIIASNLPSLREILIHGKNAWLVTPNSPEDLGEGIQFIHDNPDMALKISTNARTDALDHTWLGRANSILSSDLAKL